MPGNPDLHITHLLQAAKEGDPQAAADLLPLIYQQLRQLRQLAEARMRKIPPGQTLQPTALVHEAYLRVVSPDGPGWESRRHFFFAAARAMHDILVEQARRKASPRHGGGRKRVEATNLLVAIEAPADDMLALSEALEQLETDDPRKHKLVMLRFFAGLTAAQAAEALGVSERTVERDWRFVRAKLHKLLVGSEGQANA